MFGPSAPTNAALVDLLVDTGPDKWRRKDALKALAACEGQIAQLADREDLTLLAHDISGSHVSGDIIAVTARGVAAITRREVRRHFSFAEIAETKLLSHTKGILVRIETYRARNDFLPDDLRRHEHLIHFFTATPGAGKQVCAAIDPLLS
jgi:hypothetical protein